MSESSDHVRFLINAHHASVRHLWTCVNIGLVINAVLLIALVTILNREGQSTPLVEAAISLGGFCLTVLWLLIVRSSTNCADRWICDARRIADRDDDLKRMYFISLGFREHEQDTWPPNLITEFLEQRTRNKKFFDMTRPYPKSVSSRGATIGMVILVLTGWLLLFLWRIGALAWLG